jgi:hypothetical protein
MRVALLAPPWFPVPPPAYGGVERVVALLADGLVERGHDVTLFASGDSSTRAALVSVFDEAPSHRLGETAAELRHALACLSSASEFDLVPAAPTLHTVHGPLEGEAGSV